MSHRPFKLYSTCIADIRVSETDTRHQHKDSKRIGSKTFKMHDAYWTNGESPFLCSIGIAHLKSNSVPCFSFRFPLCGYRQCVFTHFTRCRPLRTVNCYCRSKSEMKLYAILFDCGYLAAGKACREITDVMEVHRAWHSQSFSNTFLPRVLSPGP